MENNDSILTDIENPEVEASYPVRVLVNIIDWLIEIAILIIIYFTLRETFSGLLKTSSFAIYIVVFTIMIAYRLICILFFNKTIGMMALNVKYLNRNLHLLSGKENFLAALAFRTSNIKIYKRN